MQNNIFSEVFVAQNLVTLQEVDSTNTYLRNLLAKSEPVPEGTAIMAESQTAGRGQQQNKWYSSRGESLAFSLLLKPSFLPLSQQFDLNRVVSLGIYDALHPIIGHSLKMKWPNDIYAGNYKLGGVLIENQVQGSLIKNSIIGIGLNVNQNNFPSWVPNAVSLKQILHKDYSLKELLFAICSGIRRWYIKLAGGEYSHIQDAYLQALYWLNQQQQFNTINGPIDGIITGVSPEGLIELQHNGVKQVYNLKEIEFLTSIYK